MEDFVVSARKYRPATFDSVVGQESITQTLTRAINNNQLAQAFLFCGPRGVGKTTCARILAREVNQFNSPSADVSEDFAFNIFELDAASNNSVDDIRNLIDQVRIPPQTGKYKVYIIDEVHMLSAQAFNAFLKTLEEPPSYAIFILATTEKHKILPTILSRCQIFDFHRISVSDMVAQLTEVARQEGVEVQPEALHLIAEKADGAMRDALSIFDQLVVSTDKKVTYDTVIKNLNILDYEYYFQIGKAMLSGDLTAALLIFDQVLKQGFDGLNFINGLASHLRNLMVCQNPATIQLLEVGESIRKQYEDQAGQFSTDILLAGLKLLSQADVQYKSSKNQRLLVELTLMQLCSLLIASEQKKKSDHFIAEPTDLSPGKYEELSLATAKPDVAEQQSPLKNEKAAEETAGPSQTETPRPEPAKAPEPASAPQSKPGKKPVLKNRLAGLKRRDGFALKSEEPAAKAAETIEAATAGLQEEGPAEPFTNKQLWEVWNAYTDKVQESDRMSLHATMTKNQPILKDNFQIEFLLDNEIQKIDLDAERGELVNFLRERLNNRKITLITIVRDEIDEVTPYYPEEKYRDMVKRNPLLQQMRTMWELDIDF